MTNDMNFTNGFHRESGFFLRVILYIVLILICLNVSAGGTEPDRPDLKPCENQIFNCFDNFESQNSNQIDACLPGNISMEFDNTPQNQGSIRISSNPVGADIYLDNRKTGKRTPAVLSNISAGNHLITLRMDKYADAFLGIEVSNGIESPVNLVLKQGYQNIEISTDEGGQVYLDNARVGEGNFIGRLSYGSHNLRIVKEQYRTRDTLFTIARGTELRLPHFKLYKAEGRLSITTDPSDADIIINGLNYGRTPTSIDNLVPGDHKLTLSKNGYRSIVRDIIVRDGETVNINEKLAAGGIELNFLNKPVGAEVYIDGKLIGVSPVKTIVSPGPHEILIRKEPFADYVANINAVSDLTLDFSLKSKNELIAITTYPRKVKLTVDGNIYNLPLSTPGIALPGGIHKFAFERNKFNAVEKDINVDNKTENIRILLYPQKYRNKGTAVLLSVLFPGAGQSYLNRGFTPHILLGVAGYGLAGMTYLQYEKTLDIQRDYDNELDDPVRRAELKEQGFESEKRWEQLLFATAGVWGVNIIWTLLSPSEQRKYEKLKLKFGYHDNSGTPLVGFVKNF